MSECTRVATTERRAAVIELLSLLERAAVSYVASDSEIDRLADALDHYIARSSQGWCR